MASLTKAFSDFFHLKLYSKVDHTSAIFEFDLTTKLGSFINEN